MLVLTRRTGETLMIGNGVRVTVLNVRAGQTRLGIAAPPTIPVDREEIYIRKQRQRRESEGSSEP